MIQTSGHWIKPFYYHHNQASFRAKCGSFPSPSYRPQALFGRIISSSYVKNFHITNNYSRNIMSPSKVVRFKLPQITESIIELPAKRPIKTFAGLRGCLRRIINSPHEYKKARVQQAKMLVALTDMIKVKKTLPLEKKTVLEYIEMLYSLSAPLQPAPPCVSTNQCIINSRSPAIVPIEISANPAAFGENPVLNLFQAALASKILDEPTPDMISNLDAIKLAVSSDYHRQTQKHRERTLDILYSQLRFAHSTEKAAIREIPRLMSQPTNDTFIEMTETEDRLRNDDIMQLAIKYQKALEIAKDESNLNSEEAFTTKGNMKYVISLLNELKALRQDLNIEHAKWLAAAYLSQTGEQPLHKTFAELNTYFPPSDEGRNNGWLKAKINNLIN